MSKKVKDVHVLLDVALADKIRALAEREGRSFPRQLAKLLETHPIIETWSKAK